MILKFGNIRNYSTTAVLAISMLIHPMHAQSGSVTSETVLSKPDVVLRGSVTYADRQTYKEIPFTVPSGVTRISVEFSYTERDKHTSIDLGILDPQRFRGWSGGNKSFFTLSQSDATPSYLPGTIPAGKWTLLLGIPNIEQGVESHYEAKITFTRKGEPAAVSTFSRTPLRDGPAWYRGDLHMHDAHSDGSCLSQSGRKVPCPLYKTVEAAAARKLDFIAITDHNAMSQYNDERELQPYFDRLLMIPGREITTFYGHANVFGTTDFIDFRLTSSHVPEINQMLRVVQRQHGLFSINHPGSPTGAACMGCGWTAPNTDYRLVSAIEALNGGSLDGPHSGIPFWQDKLDRGFRLTGIGGSDNHDADYTPETRSAVGHPTTVVYAQNLSEHAILDGIRAGHVFVDVEGSADRSMEFTAQAVQQNASMGDTLHSPAGEHVLFHLKLRSLDGAVPELIVDGNIKKFTDYSSAQASGSEYTFDYVSDGQRHWLRADVRSTDGKLLLLGNPIYLNF
jgi:hypothetical protein